MKVLIINTVCGTVSTGKIAIRTAEKFKSAGNEVKIAYGRNSYIPEELKNDVVKIGWEGDWILHLISGRLFDNQGLCSKAATKRFIRFADSYDPDILWLHNIHGYYLNYEMLFSWIKTKANMKVFWTLHDCWPITGHCAYFTNVGCNKWIDGCFDCAQKKEYPSSFFFDNSKDNYHRKKKAFTGVKNMTIITPSEWLSRVIEKSFLSEYGVRVVRNSIDESVFCPTKGNFRSKYSVENLFMILGVASIWEERKGLKDFYVLADRLNHLGMRFKIVLVGLTAKQMKKLPNEIIGIKRTNNQKELAEIYTAADVFFNPTRQDNYPTVNLEAEACGTPVVTYEVGGCAETIKNADSVSVNNLDDAVTQIVDLARRKNKL